MIAGRTWMIARLAVASGYVLVFIGSYHDITWHLETAAARVWFHLWPAVLVWAAHTAARIIPRISHASSVS